MNNIDWTGLIGMAGGILMALKNKLEWYMVAFSGITAYFIPKIVISIFEYYFFKLDEDISYSVGFFSGMSAFYIIQYYDDFLRFTFTKIAEWINKKTQK